MSKTLFTSESVTEGHPDKMADQISDSVLDAILEQDPSARVACETLVTTGLAFVAGEVSTNAYVDIPRVVRDAILGIGYNNAAYGIDGRTCGVMTSIDEQSPDIAQGVDKAIEIREGAGDLLDEQGAGDQGMMFGYATRETEDLMPAPIWLAHRLARRLAEIRRAGVMPYLRPDGKTQVTIEYEDGKPVRLDTILISTQHDGEIHIDTLLRPDLIEHVINPILPDSIDATGLRVLVNPTGRFELGGPHAERIGSSSGDSTAGNGSSVNPSGHRHPDSRGIQAVDPARGGLLAGSGFVAVRRWAHRSPAEVRGSDWGILCGSAPRLPRTPSHVEVVERQGIDAVCPVLRWRRVVGLRECDRWGAHRESDAGKNGLGGLRRVDRSQDTHAAAAIRTAQHVHGENPTQQVRPGEPVRTGCGVGR